MIETDRQSATGKVRQAKRDSQGERLVHASLMPCCSRWEHDAPPRELCIFFAESQIPVVFNPDSEKSLKICLRCHQKQTKSTQKTSSHDCSRHEYYISSCSETRQKTIRISVDSKTTEPQAKAATTGEWPSWFMLILTTSWQGLNSSTLCGCPWRPSIEQC